MKVLVCGGRDFEKFHILERVLDVVHKDGRISLIIEGGAEGADKLAFDYAYMNLIPSMRFPANWHKYKKAAGPIRNQQMLDEGKPDLVVAFPTKNSQGTWDMIRRAEKAGIKIIVVKEEEEEVSIDGTI